MEKMMNKVVKKEASGIGFGLSLDQFRYKFQYSDNRVDRLILGFKSVEPILNNFHALSGYKLTMKEEFNSREIEFYINGMYTYRGRTKQATLHSSGLRYVSLPVKCGGNTYKLKQFSYESIIKILDDICNETMSYVGYSGIVCNQIRPRTGALAGLLGWNMYYEPSNLEWTYQENNLRHARLIKDIWLTLGMKTWFSANDDLDEIEATILHYKAGNISKEKAQGLILQKREVAA